MATTADPHRGTAPAPLAFQASSPGAQAVDRALTVLLCFTQADIDLGIKDLAARLGLSPSTAHRLTRALVARGFLEQNEETERYHLGLATMLLGQVATRNMRLDRALPLLEALGERTGESVNLGVRENDAVVVLLRVQSQQLLRFDQPPGTLVQLHCSSMGKSMLAFSRTPIEDLDRLGELPAATPNTITDRQRFIEELDRVRSCGYSTDDEESIRGVRCVGAPLLDEQGLARAAIAIQAPSVRLDSERTRELVPLVVETSRKLAEVLRLDLLRTSPAPV